MQGSGDQNLELFDAGSRVGHLVSQGSVYAFLAEHRRRLFRGDMFADLFRSQRGRPSVPGDVITTVMVLQSLEGLSDRDAVDSIRSVPRRSSRRPPSRLSEIRRWLGNQTALPGAETPNNSMRGDTDRSARPSDPEGTPGLTSGLSRFW
jgi:hypothetical protein